MNKVGNSGHIWRLISMVLAVVILVFLFWGVAYGVEPSLDKVEDYYDNVAGQVKFFFKIGFDESCYVDKINGLVDSEAILKSMGMSGREVEFGRCEGVCNISSVGFPSYRYYDGKFERLVGSEWKDWFDFVSQDVEKDRWYRDLYGEVVLALEEESGNDGSFDFGLNGDIKQESTKKFVLYGNGNGRGPDILAIWQNGLWEVRLGPRTKFFTSLSESSLSDSQDSSFEQISSTVKNLAGGVTTHISPEDGRTIIDFGDNNDGKVFNLFISYVDTVWDDKVYWSILDKDSFYDETKDKGSAIGSFIDIKNKGISDKLYYSIVAAEHGVNPDHDLWIRTEVVGSGSSAYGPVQLTKDLAQGYLNNGKIEWSEEEREYLERFVDQGWVFLAHGGMSEVGVVDEKQINANKEVYDRLKIKVGDKYNSNYDYGGAGYLTTPKDKEMYIQVTKKMLNEIYERNGGDINKFWREWRFGANNGFFDSDSGYNNRFKRAWNGFSDNGELDSPPKYYALASAFAEKKIELLKSVDVSDDLLKKVGDDFNSRVIEVGGESFDLGVESFDNNFIITIDSVSGDDKYGLMYNPYSTDEAGASFWGDNLEYRDIPFDFVEWDGYGWNKVGDSSFYRLAEEDFEEVVRATGVFNFLRERCLV